MKTVPIVTENNSQVITSSRNIAEFFEKQHKNVLQSIESLLDILPTEFGRLNFQPTSYTDQWIRQQPEYLVTKDGFTLLAMGFTGEKAIEFKISYIEAFNRMEQILLGHVQSQSDIPKPQPKPLSTRKILTIKEAANLIDGLTEYRIRQMCKSGQLPCFMAGKKYLISEEVLMKIVFSE